MCSYQLSPFSVFQSHFCYGFLSRFGGPDIRSDGPRPPRPSLTSVETGTSVRKVSSDSKSNSPLLNGNVPNGNPIFANGELIGKHDGFTMTPIRTASSANPVRKAPPAPVGKPSISSPSFRGSTNKAVCHPTSPPPVPPAPSSTKFSNDDPPPYSSVVPVAVVTPNRRPLSVPDESCILAGRAAPPPPLPKPSPVSRLASFLKKDQSVKSDGSDEEPDSSRSNTLPRKAAKIKRESLMQLEISAPMELHATKLPDNLVPVRPAPCPPSQPNVKPSNVKATQNFVAVNGGQQLSPTKKTETSVKIITELPRRNSKENAKVKWASSIPEKEEGDKSELQRLGSMRAQPVTMRPSIPKFGSMRSSRPKSLPPTRPSQPPPRPPLPDIPPSPENYYDDCADDGSSRPVASSPTDSIYATIEDTPALPPDEPYYENNAAVKKHNMPSKEPKKSVFSFLYAKTKRKKKEVESAEEPLYCNVDRASESPELDSIVADPTSSKTVSMDKKDSFDRSSPLEGVIVPDRTSCGSSESGGLLSEIVTELVTREPEFKQALSKNKKRGAITSLPSVEATSPVLSSPSTSSSKVSTNLSSSPSKASSSPFKLSLPSSSKASSSGEQKFSSSSSTGKPRGVFSYLRRNLSDDTEKTEVQKTGNTSTAVPDIMCPITAISNTTITAHISTSPTIADTKTSSSSSAAPTVTPFSSSKSLESSLASVRAASSQLTSSKSSLSAYTNVPSRSVGDKAPKLPSKGNKLTEESLPESVLGSDRKVPSDASQSSKDPKQVISTKKSPPPVHKPLKSNKLVFPPDKVLFPPDKTIPASGPKKEVTSLSRAGTRGSGVGKAKSAPARGRLPSSTAKGGEGGSKSSRTSGPDSGKQSDIASNDSKSAFNATNSIGTSKLSSSKSVNLNGKAADSGSKVSVNSSGSVDSKLHSMGSKPVGSKPSSAGSKASSSLSKPGPGSKTNDAKTSSSAPKNSNRRVLSPTRTSEKPSSAAPSHPPSAGKTTKSPSSSRESSSADLSTRDTSKRSSGGKGGKKITASRGQVAYAGKAVGNSNVASLQQKFEVGGEPSTASKPTGKRRPSDTTKPNLAPKPT